MNGVAILAVVVSLCGFVLAVYDMGRRHGREDAQAGGVVWSLDIDSAPREQWLLGWFCADGKGWWSPLWVRQDGVSCWRYDKKPLGDGVDVVAWTPAPRGPEGGADASKE